MKHELKVTILLLILFFTSQVVGLAIIDRYIDHAATEATGVATFKELPYQVERPEVEEGTSFGYIIVAILIGTAILLLLIRFKKVMIIKAWFFIVAWLCLAFAFSAFISSFVASILAFIVAVWRTYRPNVIIHNVAELFIYGGLAAIFVPMINLFAAFMLLLFISIYDMFAVWHSKHMVKLAKFQTKSNIFAGMLIPYGVKAISAKKAKKMTKTEKLVKVKTRHAILGGGDIGFPLIFAGVVMKGLMLQNTLLIGFLKTLIIPVCVTIALMFLFMKGQKDKFYPAMPFLSMGCVVGYLIILGINLI
jgi:presenilin-like A22 family membrane protease